MEDLLTYSKYKQVLCIAFDEYEDLVIETSSNRAIDVQQLASFRGNTLQGKSFQSLLKEYLDACAKEQDQQSEKEKHVILIVQQFARQLKQNLFEDDEILFDKCQFLFILPLGWACNKYMDQLRAMLMETEWIHQKDPKNRLIFSPFIESLCQGLTTNNVNKFEREKKYLLLSLSDTAIHVSSFEMQSSKELIAVSKKLAASDFLLLPTDLGDGVTMETSRLDRLLYNRVKKIIIRHILYSIIIRRILNSIQRKSFYKKSSFRFKNGNKKTIRKQLKNINAASQPLLSKTSLHQLIKGVLQALDYICGINKDRQVNTVMRGCTKSKKTLKGLTGSILINNLLADANIKGFIDQVVFKVKELYSNYGNEQNSPDGIQDIILFCYSNARIFYRELLQMALHDANVIDAQNEGFYASEVKLICFGAMQKPLKMVQIANALLPPIIWKDGSSKQLEWTDYNRCEEDLLPPNSFYVQAYINDDHIRFILNKVIAISSLNGTVQKSTFTIQEMSVELESIFDSVCDTMWNHLMMFECQRDPDLFDQCDRHLAGEYSAANYYFFKCSIHEMTEKLLQEDFTKCNQDIDSNHAIPLSKECNCSFQISFRTLINIGLQPAISHIATIIASSLASDSFFGLYTVSALIIMDDSKYTLLQHHHNIFEKTLRKCLQAHHGRTIVFYNRETLMACESLGSWRNGLQQVFGKGSYSQVSTTDYVLEFWDGNTYDDQTEFTMYKYHSNSLEKGHFFERPNGFFILNKGQAVDPNGSMHAFYRRGPRYNTTKIGLHIINRHESEKYSRNSWFQGYYGKAKGYPFTIRVTPQHHSSTIEFEVSYVKDYLGIYPASESFSIQERLSLK